MEAYIPNPTLIIISNSGTLSWKCICTHSEKYLSLYKERLKELGKFSLKSEAKGYTTALFKFLKEYHTEEDHGLPGQEKITEGSFQWM